MVPKEARSQIHEWVQAQDWPEGTVFKEPHKYHTTLVYSPNGYEHPRRDALLAAMSPPASFKVWTARVMQMAPGNDLHVRPMALVLSNRLLVQWVEEMIELARATGFAPRVYGGYTPHITVADIPPGPLFEPAPPDITWMTPMQVTELHEYYKSFREHK